MENRLELNERSMLKGVGAAGFTAAFTFVYVMLLRLCDIQSVEVTAGIILPVISAACVLFMLLSGGLKDYVIRFVTFIVTAAAMLLIYIRVGIGKDMILFPAIGFLAYSAGGAVIAGIISLFLSRNERYADFIENNDALHGRLSVCSIAAAFICIACASMIYG